MNIREMLSKEIVKKILLLMLCLLVALMSIFVVAKRATAPENYKKTIQSLDDKKATVMGVTTAAAATSTAFAAIPGDATTPIASQIMDMSSYLLIVVCALVLEKALLTVLGYLSFNILVPLACILFAVSILAKRNALKVLSLKIVVFALVIATIIPFSLKISDLIYEANMSSVSELTPDIEEIDGGEEEKSWWESVVDKVEKGVSGAGEKAKELVNKFIDVIALFIVTYCAIPIIVFIAVIWFIKFLFNITIPVPLKEKSGVLNEVNKKNTPDESGQDDYGKE